MRRPVKRTSLLEFTKTIKSQNSPVKSYKSLSIEWVRREETDGRFVRKFSLERGSSTLLLKEHNHVPCALGERQTGFRLLPEKSEFDNWGWIACRVKCTAHWWSVFFSRVSWAKILCFPCIRHGPQDKLRRHGILTVHVL